VTTLNVEPMVIHPPEPITVDTQSPAHSNAEIVGSNVCFRSFCVCVVLCVDSGLATG
jgi:hypothetical protein